MTQETDPRKKILNDLRAGAFGGSTVPWSHFGRTVHLPNGKLTFVEPKDHIAFANIMEWIDPYLKELSSTYSCTRHLDQFEILQAFLGHFYHHKPNNPKRKYQQYGHKKTSCPYEFYLLTCYCNFLKERYGAMKTVFRGAPPTPKDPVPVRSPIPDESPKFEGVEIVLAAEGDEEEGHPQPVKVIEL